jgi:hypothetical protein
MDMKSQSTGPELRKRIPATGDDGATDIKKPKLRSSSDASMAVLDHAVCTNGNRASTNETDNPAPFVDRKGDVICAFIDLSPIKRTDSRPAPSPLTPEERKELESVLEFHVAVGAAAEENGNADDWREDWSGNLAYMDKEISNPRSSREKKSFKQTLLHWARHMPACTRLAYNLIRYVYNLEQTPDVAKNILTLADESSVDSIEKSIRRVSYDPAVLRADGWTTTRSETKQGATGGPFLVGAKVRIQDSDAVVIAYVHDPDIGDLWKAFWIDEQLTFDLEAEELLDAKRKWERRYSTNAAKPDPATTRRSFRFTGSSDFTVAGIQYGVVLAASYNKSARPGVYWPARVMHASETLGSSTVAKRSSAKQKVDVVFLCPYWSDQPHTIGRRRVDSMSETNEFESGSLFSVESIDATDEMIKEYAYGSDSSLDLAELRTSFRFTGLPKPAFSRYLDSHRLAMALRKYAKALLKAEFAPTDLASVGLFETHKMSIQSPLFPPVVLHLPFEFVLTQLRKSESNSRADDFGSEEEPVLKLNVIIDAMKPPTIWGLGKSGVVANVSPVRSCIASPDFRYIKSAALQESPRNQDKRGVQGLFEDVTLGLPRLATALSKPSTLPSVEALKHNFGQLLASIGEFPFSETEVLREEVSRKKRKLLLQTWATVKRFGSDVLSSLPECEGQLYDWKKCTERVYRLLLIKFSTASEGNGVSTVLTDYRCNGHRTASGCFERAVRLPAAIKGAKMAGAGKNPTIRLVTSVHNECIEFVEQTILPMAHSRSYLQRMKDRCVAAKSDDESLALTDDSNGIGGDDTSKFRTFAFLFIVLMLLSNSKSLKEDQEVPGVHLLPPLRRPYLLRIKLCMVTVSMLFAFLGRQATTQVDRCTA